MSYFCKHDEPLERRCLECDILYGFIPREYVEELKLLRALALEVQEATTTIKLPKAVLDLLKVMRIYRS